MTKKTYIYPVMTVVQLRQQSVLLPISGAESQGLDPSDLNYDENGGSQSGAW